MANGKSLGEGEGVRGEMLEYFRAKAKADFFGKFDMNSIYQLMMVVKELKDTLENLHMYTDQFLAHSRSYLNEKINFGESHAKSQTTKVEGKGGRGSSKNILRTSWTGGVNPFKVEKGTTARTGGFTSFNKAHETNTQAIKRGNNDGFKNVIKGAPLAASKNIKPAEGLPETYYVGRDFHKRTRNDVV